MPYLTVKVNFTLAQVVKAQGGADVQFYSFFNLGAGWGWVVNAMPLPFYPQKKDLVPII
jgi:hypothetical protein